MLLDFTIFWSPHMKIQLVPANSRGHLNFGWLDAHHTFSFGEYYNRNMMHFGALRVLNDDLIAPQSMFPLHPHNNMEIITVVLSGTIEHQDSMGNKAQVTAGEIQVMSAGSGIYHSEANPDDKIMLNSFQIWIMPKLRDITPRYDQQSFISQLNTHNCWHTIVTPDGRNATLMINQDAFLSLGNFDAAHPKKHTYTRQQTGNGIFLMVIEGSITLDNHQLNRRDAVMIEDSAQISFIANQDCRLLVIEVPMIFK